MDLLSIVTFAGIAVALILLIWIVLRPAAKPELPELEPLSEKLGIIKADLDRLDRTLRENAETGRAAAAEQGSELRREIAGTLAESRAELNQLLLGARKESSEASGVLREEMQRTLALMADNSRASSKEAADAQRLELEKMVKRVELLAQTNAEALEKLRDTLALNLTTLRNENSEKLELMRKTVDEQLQGTLEKRLGDSFKLVSDRLEQVHKGLGEMQTLATGVGDLKRVLSNVKVRGTWGETQLANLLAQVFSPEQYRTNVSTYAGSTERVEFAIRLPGKGPDDEEVLLPIDAKFPHEDYERLVRAAEAADTEEVENAGRALEARIRSAAKDIREKYIHPPETTDFAILFLPTEGLYAELLRRVGLADQLQHEYRVVMAGPTTLNALVNSLQMGFQTLAIQRRSSDVWKILGAVKTEFVKYGDVLDKVQKKLVEATNTVDKVAVRYRAVNRSLRAVSDVSESNAAELLRLGPGLEAEASEDDEAEFPVASAGV